MNAMLPTGTAALFCSAVAYVLLRWRVALAFAATRERQRYMGAYVPRSLPWLRLSIAPPCGVHLVGVVVVGLAFALLAGLMWACFLGALLAAARGEVAPPVAMAEQFPCGRAHPIGAALFLIVWAGFWLRGIRMLLNPREAARYHAWLYNTSLPLDAPYPKEGDVSAVQPTHRSVVLAAAVGAGLILLGLLPASIGIAVLLS